ncbi:hypothetical protein PVBG_05779 [Plasmodium vivax Brazil I]|uniref:Variable surface protein n=1 Tax=Plasmodium vivax (strain Brazil I) TaxID=1033975 RepID=A0A0J9SJL4_PLAV1|nr:hypothetical protein PVBG_05779 [Plasmodium vivax Brazil I]
MIQLIIFDIILINKYFMYDFLNDIWKKYDNFDKPVENDRHYNKYIPVCDLIVTKPNENIDNHKNFCMKLVRNLGRYSPTFEFLNFTPEDCTDLNNWVYNSMKKYDIPDNISVKCFQDYIDFVSKINVKTLCPYYPYDDMYEEPINIIILKIFESNMNIIQKIVDGTYDYINFPLITYICECIKIYKKMYRQYCRIVDADNAKRKGTCDMLYIFKMAYNSFLFGKIYKNYKIPSLDNDEEEYLSMCQPDAPKLALTKEMAEKIPALQDATQDGERKSDDIPPISTVADENQGSSISRTLSTAVGTMAGASSIIALLYKVTQNCI